jgi:hypothetical protein
MIGAMGFLSLPEVEKLRARTCRRAAGVRKIRSEAEAVSFIEQMGFLPLMKIAGSVLPDLASACIRPPDWRRDYREWWWGWKQTLPEKRLCYYAKIVRRCGTFISWEMLPNFLVVFGAMQPYDERYRAGLLGRAEKQILDILAQQGPMFTDDLRSAFAPAGHKRTLEFHRAMASLQSDFLVAVCGGRMEGWTMHKWDLTERIVPRECWKLASKLDRRSGVEALVLRLIRNTIISGPGDICWTFSLDRVELREIVAALLREGRLAEVEVEGLEGKWLTLPDFAGR